MNDLTPESYVLMNALGALTDVLAGLEGDVAEGRLTTAAEVNSRVQDLLSVIANTFMYLAQAAGGMLELVPTGAEEVPSGD